MKLIDALVSGVRGCENGSASFYKRGTSTFAGYYDTFEADGTLNSTGSIDLDSNGGAVVYVNEMVTVVAKDSDGNPVREFVAGDNASAIEVISPSFTGTDYETAQSGADKPTTLQAILDLWKTNSGATDWKVLLGGVATTIENAFLTIPLWYNVKAYGAIGDGSTDDTVAIRAAMTAAAGPASSGPYGGIVYFPAGTYKITDELTLSPANHTIGIFGVGESSRIIQYTAGKKTLKGFDGGGRYFIQDMFFSVNGSVTADSINIESLASVSIRRCRFVTFSGSAIKIASSSTDGSMLRVAECDFTLGATLSKAVNNANTNAAGAFIDVDSCTIAAAANYATSSDSWIYSQLGHVRACRFDQTNLTGAGAFAAVESAATSSSRGTLAVSDCWFYGTTPPGGNWYAMKETATARILEWGNYIQRTVYSAKMATESVPMPAGDQLRGGHFSSNQNSVMTSTTAATKDLSGFFQDYGTIWCDTTVATTFSGATISIGRKIILIIKNADSGAHTPLFDGTTIFPLAAVTSISAGNHSIFELFGVFKIDGSLRTVAFPIVQNSSF